MTPLPPSTACCSVALCKCCPAQVSATHMQHEATLYNLIINSTTINTEHTDQYYTC